MEGADRCDMAREIITGQAEFVDVRVVGEFEDAESTVDPQASISSS